MARRKVSAAEAAGEKAREEFIATFAELQRVRVALGELVEKSPINEEFKQACAEALGKIGGKKAKDPIKALREADTKTFDSIFDRYRARADQAYEEAKRPIKPLEEKLRELAITATARDGAFPAMVYESWISTYSSQGFGAETYAQGAARVFMMHIFHCAPNARIEKIHSTTTGKVQGFAVYVSVEDPIDAEIIKRKPGLTTREWVKACWKTGINPRVLNPWLPVGYEERNGIDYAGNDVPPTNVHRVLGELPS